MLSETGTIIAVDTDGVWVETLQQSACGQCKARHGCGQKMLATAESRLTRIKALYGEYTPRVSPQLGQEVTIGVDANAMVRGALFSYGIPLAAMLLAVVMATLITEQELVAVIASALGLFVGGLIVRRHAQTLPNGRRLQAVLLSSNTHLPGI